MQTFKDQVVWVTGASSGIGLAMVRQLDREGARLILSSRSEDKLKEIATGLSGTEHIVLPLDLENTSNANEWVRIITDRFGRIDCLINNGGISQRAEAHLTPLEIDRRMMEVNYFGNITLTKAVLPIMMEQKSGRIIVISSIAGKFGFYLRSAYSAAKHALHGFYESLALEQATNGIHITIACPGKINTDISLNALNSEGSTHGVMDHNQATGMSAEQCALEILLAAKKNLPEVLVGGKEIKAVFLKRYFPNLFRKIIRKQSPT